MNSAVHWRDLVPLITFPQQVPFRLSGGVACALANWHEPDPPDISRDLARCIYLAMKIKWREMLHSLPVVPDREELLLLWP